MHDLHYAIRCQFLAHRSGQDESFRIARRKRIGRLYQEQGVRWIPGREDVAACEAVEVHRQIVNAFVFDDEK